MGLVRFVERSSARFPLDVPEGAAVATDLLGGDTDLVDLETGRAMVRRANRRAIRLACDRDSCDWQVLVECDTAETTPVITLRISANGVGRLRREVDVPLRVVQHAGR